MTTKGISKSTLARLPVYLDYLKSMPSDSPQNISATSLAYALKLGEVQVRKDLAAVSGAGKPKIGYDIASLIHDLESFLGYDDVNDAVLVGAGKLGTALLEYSGFQQYGLNIVAAFDSSTDILEADGDGKIFHISKFEDLCKRLNARIGIITVPAKHAQEICDLMVKNGILAIWNFAPTHLTVPDNILVQNENMAASLALLSGHLAEEMKNR